MAATSTYFPTLLKVESTPLQEKESVNGLSWIAYSTALGILSYYAPKTFLATSLGLTVYHVYRFHQVVHSKSLKEIRAWALHTCAVMSSIGTVFGLQCLPWFRSSLKAARHFQLFRSAGHGLAGLLFIAVGWGGLFGPFSQTEKQLSATREWVPMRDFVENYPPRIKKSITRIGLFISALLPNTIVGAGLAYGNLIFNQFRSPQLKLERLWSFFASAPSIPPVSSHLSWEYWKVAIHQFQGLPIEAQLRLGPHLARIAKASAPFEVGQLPEDVNLILYNEHLKSFEKIPSYGEEKRSEWLGTLDQFNRLRPEQRDILGEQISRLVINSSPPGPGGLVESESILRTALKHFLKSFARDPTDAKLLWAQRVMESLSYEICKDFGTEMYVVAGKLTTDELGGLSEKMNFALLHHTLSLISSVMPSFKPTELTLIRMLYQNLRLRSHSDIETELNRIAQESDQRLIDQLPNSAFKTRLTQLKDGERI